MTGRPVRSHDSILTDGCLTGRLESGTLTSRHHRWAGTSAQIISPLPYWLYPPYAQRPGQRTSFRRYYHNLTCKWTLISQRRRTPFCQNVQRPTNSPPPPIVGQICIAGRWKWGGGGHTPPHFPRGRGRGRWDGQRAPALRVDQTAVLQPLPALHRAEAAVGGAPLQAGAPRRLEQSAVGPGVLSGRTVPRSPRGGGGG